MSKNPYPYDAIQLNTGAWMPLLGLGTWLSKPGEVGPAVKNALKIGYRHLDCAEVYDNEPEIGKALTEVYAEGKIKREDIFITSKLNARTMVPSGIAKVVDKTLSDLQTTYLDLYLIHQPVPCKVVDGKAVPQRGVGWGVQDVWRELEKIHATGKIKAIGISNFPTVILNDLLCYAKVHPAVHQIERTPYLVQHKHVEFCRKNGLVITAYGSLGAPVHASSVRPDLAPLMKNQTIHALANKHGKSPAQVLIRWSMDSQCITIPKSVNEERLKQNFAVWDFKLSKEEVEQIDKLDANIRVFEQDWHTVPTFT